MRHAADLIEIHLTEFRYLQSEPEAQGNPIAGGFAQFALADR